MDNNKMLVGVAIFLGIFLAFPFVAQHMKKQPVEEAAASTGATTAPAAAQLPSDPPLWNAMNIIGTEWKVNWEGRDLKLIIMPNGICHVYHPLMRNVAGRDYVEGQWRVDYDIAYVDIVFGTQEFHFALKIRGYDIYDPDGKRVERFK